MSETLNPRLPVGLEDARILLAHAAESGTGLDADLVKTLVDSGIAIDAKSVDAKLEAEFWGALDKLAKKLSPVSVSSLRATMDSYTPATGKLLGIFKLPGGPRPGRSLARRAVQWHTRILFSTLMSLLVLQIYWLCGTSITGEIQKNRKETADVQAKQRELEQQRVTSAATTKAASTPTTEAVVRAQTMEAGLLKLRLEKLAARDVTELKLLRGWSWIWEHVLPISKICGDTKSLDGMDEVNRIIGEGTPAQRKVAKQTLRDLTSLMFAYTLEDVQGRTALLNGLIAEMSQVIDSVQVDPPYDNAVKGLTKVIDSARTRLAKEKKTLLPAGS